MITALTRLSLRVPKSSLIWGRESIEWSPAIQPLLRRRLITTAGETETVKKGLDFYLDKSRAGPDFVDDDLVALPGFLSQAEQQSLVDELEPELKRRHWEHGHWDSVIREYREMPRSINRWNPANQAIIARVHNTTELVPQPKWFNYVHVIDLHENGEIGAHREHNDYCGSIVAGLCLLSPRLMEFKKADAAKDDPDQPVVRLFLEPGMMYIMRRTMRFDWTHGVLGGVQEWRGTTLTPERRISLIFRDARDLKLPGMSPETRYGSMRT